ncbi:MAG: AsnC family transcriptional regulator [Limnochordales bacterium]|nr:AsnC family transcriptional regulator [Limnochordales bacterium]
MDAPGVPRWDELDEKILQLLRVNGRMPLAEIALQVGVAVSTVSNRIRRLSEAGVVQGYRPLVNPRFSVAGVEALVTVASSNPRDLQLVLQELQAAGVRIGEVYRTLGSTEYICRVVAPGVDHLDRAMASFERLENIRVSLLVLTELVAFPEPSLDHGTPTGPLSEQRPLEPGTRLYFVSLTEYDPDRTPPAQVVEYLARAGYRTLVVDAVNPWGAYYASRRLPLAPHCHGRDLLAAFCEASRSRGVNLLAAIECRAMPQFLAAQHPSWLQRYAGGEAAKAYGPFFRGCFRGNWQEWLRSLAKELLETYPLDGLVALNPEYDPSACYCDNCRQGFQAHNGMQLPAKPDSIDYPTWSRWLEWKVAAINQFIVSLANLVHAHSPRHRLLVMSDQALSDRSQAYGIRLQHLAERCDGVVCAGEPGIRSSAPLLESLDRCERGAALASRQTFIASLSGSYAPWTYYAIPAEPLQLALDLMAAAGQNVACLDLGRVEELPPASPVAGVDILSVPRQPLWHYCALLYSPEDWCTAAGRQARPSHADCFRGFYKALTRASLPFEVISLLKVGNDPSALEKLSTFRTLILPSLNDLPISMARWLVHYVEAGGSVVGSFLGIMNQPQTDVAIVLEDLFGLARVEPPVQVEAAYTVITCGQLRETPSVLPAYPRWLPVQTDRAEVWGTILAQESAWGGLSQTNKPALVATKRGRGRTLLFTFPFGALYDQFSDPGLEMLLRAVLSWAAGEESPLLIESERSLVCRASRALESPERAWLYIVDGDYVFAPRPWRRPPQLPHGRVILRLPRPPRHASWTPSGHKASWERVEKLPSGKPVDGTYYAFPFAGITAGSLLVIDFE